MRNLPKNIAEINNSIYSAAVQHKEIILNTESSSQSLDEHSTW